MTQKLLDLLAEAGRDMLGTTESNEYFPLLATELGRVGVRILGSRTYRIRVEPNDEGRTALAVHLTRDGNWKQPGDQRQNRFSTMAYTPEMTATAVLNAAKALQGLIDSPAVVNVRAPERFRKLIDSSGLPEEDRIKAFIESEPAISDEELDPDSLAEEGAGLGDDPEAEDDPLDPDEDLPDVSQEVASEPEPETGSGDEEGASGHGD